MEIDDSNLHSNNIEYQSFQECCYDDNLQLLESFDFEAYLEETLSKSAKIYEERVEAEKAKETEKFFKEAYDNLVNMECSSPPAAITEEHRKETEKFLKDSFDNLRASYV